MERDFGITDSDSTLAVLFAYFKATNLETRNTILAAFEDLEMEVREDGRDATPALTTAMMGHIITATTDLGYIDKGSALNLLAKVSVYAKTHNSSWENYEENFLLGNDATALNTGLGRKVLTKYLGYLKGKVGSPWNNVDWNR